MCSRHEGIGRVTVEAMAAGRLVIGFDSGGTAELIQPGRTGLLYIGDHRQLEAMGQLVQDPSWARQLGRQGQQQACQYTQERYGQQVFEILTDTVRRFAMAGHS